MAASHVPLCCKEPSDSTGWLPFAELLDVYRAAILRMQQQLRRMPSVSLASLNFSLQEFKVHSP